jgi:hypothetical protein
MHRTEGEYNSSNLFVDGPPGTRVEEDWLNAVQEELANVIEGAGITLKTASTETRDQLNAAIAALVKPKIIQIVETNVSSVATGSTAFPVDDTIPQNTEGTEFITLSITPQKATNKLRIDVIWNGSATGTNTNIGMGLFQDSTANALAAVLAPKNDTSTSVSQIQLSHYMTAGTTSVTTFKIRVGDNSGNTITFNGVSGGRIFGGIMSSSIIITEFEM